MASNMSSNLLPLYPAYLYDRFKVYPGCCGLFSDRNESHGSTLSGQKDDGKELGPQISLYFCLHWFLGILMYRKTAKCNVILLNFTVVYCNRTTLNFYMSSASRNLTTLLTVRYNAIQYNTIQYNAIQYNTIQYNTIQCNTIQYNTIQHNTIRYNTIHFSVIQNSR